MNILRYLVLLILLVISWQSSAQVKDNYRLWHGKERTIRYLPDGEDFIIRNGGRRFNRALYGTNSGFRVEAGDLPEFALYMPGMGGNLKFGLVEGNKSKWLIEADSILARYKPGSMSYDIKDSILGEGSLKVVVLALSDGEGIIIKVEFNDVPSNVRLVSAFGGATGKKFSRDGDIGADPESSFYLKSEYCEDNVYQISSNSFNLSYGTGKVLTEAERYKINHSKEQKKEDNTKVTGSKQLKGVFPQTSSLHVGDATNQALPLELCNSKGSDFRVLVAQSNIVNRVPFYFLVYKPIEHITYSYSQLPLIFEKSDAARKKIAGRIKLNTPDPYINTLGGALSVAADAIWEDPTYLHGAIAWRMRLNGWRGAYTADPLGWHDRAKAHFSSYIKSQLITPETGEIVPDTALNFARQKEKLGTTLFSEGYICRNPNGDFRPHHYDMNLVFIDQLLRHFNWTGDLDYVKETFPAIKRHLKWEKRNFDRDNDGLYDAYAAIWASDALQYSGGAVTHSSAYNYKANQKAAQLAQVIGEDSSPYLLEASKILKAINSNLWVPQLGRYAEYKDLTGLQQVHPAAGIWTVYHAIDSDVHDAFKGYQSLRYVDTEIPRIPIIAKGFPEGDFYTISTTNWMPYTWSINNVALAETLHTSLAYWQGGRSQEAFKLWKGVMLESMYLSASPGGFQQLSFYDAIRGELYRDFADPIGMASRTLVEGLFGILPDALNDTLVIKPGFPDDWYNASLEIPDISLHYKREGMEEVYTIIPSFEKQMKLKLQLTARTDSIIYIKINGMPTSWKNIDKSVGCPQIGISAGKASKYIVEISWLGTKPEKPLIDSSFTTGEAMVVNFNKAVALEVFDPQNVLEKEHISRMKFSAMVHSGLPGHKTVFVKVKQGKLSWWVPLDIQVKQPLEIARHEEKNAAEWEIALTNNTEKEVAGKIVVNEKGIDNRSIKIPANSSSTINVPNSYLLPGSNKVQFTGSKMSITQFLIDWRIKASKGNYEKIDLNHFFNDKVTNIFKNKYLSPRPTGPTLQLPLQGIGNWCYPLIEPAIDDIGLRKTAGQTNEFSLPQGIPFATPGKSETKNIIFTSLWDNYPDQVTIPLHGKASHAYILMAGSTNHMQSRFNNGAIVIRYKDNSGDTLRLRNPENWWPIEQDYFEDGFAFHINSPKPPRIHLKTGTVEKDFKEYSTIKGYSNIVIDGGAASVLDLPLNSKKELKSIQLVTYANDVVIGLMGVTLKRD